MTERLASPTAATPEVAARDDRPRDGGRVLFSHPYLGVVYHAMEERLALLFEVVASKQPVLILPHNEPDPDAIASAVALDGLLAEKAGVESTIGYRGIIGRAENRALVRYLGEPLHPVSQEDLAGFPAIALVDTQPGTGNNALPAERTATIVIDHHPLREATATASFADVRPEVGATSSILTLYLQVAGIEPDPRLATALFYGVKSDTMGLSRGVGADDLAAYLYLQPRIEAPALVEIENAQVPAAYFRSFDATLRAVRIYDGVVVAYVGWMDYPDLAAEMADLLLRLNSSQWVICMGAYQEQLILSLRTRNPKLGAELLVVSLVKDASVATREGTAGGHGRSAGGQIPLEGRDPALVAERVREKALQVLKIPPGLEGEVLV